VATLDNKHNTFFLGMTNSLPYTTQGAARLLIIKATWYAKKIRNDMD
jgi:hypothetical protein